MNDKEFWEHLQKQMERDRAEQGLTTMQILKQRQRDKQQPQQQQKKKPTK